MTQLNINNFLYPYTSKESINSILFVFDHQQFSPKRGDKWHMDMLYLTDSDEAKLMDIASRLDNGELVSIFEYPYLDKYEIQILKRLVAAPGYRTFEFDYHALESIKFIETLLKARNTINKYVTYVPSSVFHSDYGKILIGFLQRYGELVFYKDDWYKVFLFNSVDKCKQAQHDIFAFLQTDFDSPSYMWSRIKDLNSIIKQLKKS